MAEMDSQTEGQLITRCQAGDKEAFGTLVQHYMQRAYYTALALVGSADDALDLSQDAFVRAFRAVKQFQPMRGSFFTWYYQILRNLCFNLLRNRARRAQPFSQLDDHRILQMPDSAQDPGAVAEQNELRAHVWHAIAALKEQEREIIVLRDIQGLSYKEIAELLECPIGTVMSRLFNARKQLREKMDGYL